MNPSVASLRAQFGSGIGKSRVVCGDTIVYVDPTVLRDVMTQLQQAPEHDYKYLVDITAVEFDFHPKRRAPLRVKVELDKREPLAVPSMVPLWKAANWLEREVYDMFGIRFEGHPDLRRILMWETYAEGHPLRKDFPLRGRFSRAEQVRQALNANPEAHYSMEELSIADAYVDLPADMKERLARGERGRIPGPEDG